MATVCIIRRRHRPRSAHARCRYIDIDDYDSIVLRRTERELGRQPLGDALALSRYADYLDDLEVAAATDGSERPVRDHVTTEATVRANDDKSVDSGGLAHRDRSDHENTARVTDPRDPQDVTKRDQNVQTGTELETKQLEAMVSERMLEIERERSLQIAEETERLRKTHQERMDAIASGEIPGPTTVNETTVEALSNTRPTTTNETIVEAPSKARPTTTNETIVEAPSKSRPATTDETTQTGFERMNVLDIYDLALERGTGTVRRQNVPGRFLAYQEFLEELRRREEYRRGGY